MIITNSFYMETYGCTFNQSDSDKISKLLIQIKLISTIMKSAEYIIINTCAVKSQTQEKIISRIRNLVLDKNQKLIIAGCLPFISNKVLTIIKESNKNIIGIIDVNSINNIEYVIKKHNNQRNIIILTSKSKIDKSKYLPYIKKETNTGIIQICEGCDRNCTYCCTRISRGKIYSYPLESIINNISYHISYNIKELFLTAQDCGNYLYEQYGLAELLKIIERHFKNSDLFIRIGMTNPLYLIKNLNKIIDIVKNDLFYTFLHIPIQSASNNILKSMRRGYTNQQLQNIFSQINNNQITLSTDIICGFPGETIDDFKYTKDFILNFKPDIINISKFTPRPNTPASKLKQLDSKIIKNRTKELTNLYNSYIVEKNLRWIGWKGKVLINKLDENKKYPLFGRNKYYKPIILANGEINKFVKVKIIDLRGNSLIAKIIDE